MFKKLTLAVAAGTGYVLGAKAGKERYAQIEAKFREVAGMPAVQNATSTLKDNAAPILDSAKETVSGKVSSATDKASQKSGTGSSTPPPSTPAPGVTSTPGTTTPPVSPVTGTGAATGATTRPTPAPGAAPSGTTL